jgi:hypothetical protein
MEAYQERVVAEKAELSDKLSKLEAFVMGKAFDSVSAPEQARLSRQCLIMQLYVQVLSERIEAF